MRILFLSISLLFTSIIFCQSNIYQEKSFIDVVGTAEQEIVPNEIYIDLQLKERVENRKKIDLNQLENQLKATLASIQIPEENLFIADVNAVLSKTSWLSKEVLSFANYTLKIDGAKKLKELFGCLEELKITNANITKATHSNIVNLRKENRIKAIKMAKEKADYLLNAIGEKTGKPIKVNEIEQNNPQIFAFANSVNAEGYSSTSKSRNKIIQFKKIKIKSSIYIQFKIK